MRSFLFILLMSFFLMANASAAATVDIPENSDGKARAELLMVVHGQLPSILRSHIDNASDEYSDKAFNLFLNTFPEIYGSQYQDRITIQFVSEDSRFQVVGIEPERLAINTGSTILFNLRGLAKLPSFTVADAVQLWLHEIMHLDKETPLATKDAWTTRLAEFTKSHLTEIDMGNDKKVSALLLPDHRPTTVFYRKQYSSDYRLLGNHSEELDILASIVKDGFLLVEQTKDSARLMLEAYASFTTFDNSIYSGRPSKIGSYSDSVLWPHILINSVRKTATGLLQINYSQYLQRHPSDGNKIDSITPYVGSGYGIDPDYPSSDFRIEINPARGDYETQRSYSQDLKLGSFEVVRVQDSKDKRYVSLRVKNQQIYSMLTNSSAHVTGRDLKNFKQLSFEVRKFRTLSPDEVLLHLEIPNKNLELTQVLIPFKREDSYAEITIKPEQPQTLLGKIPFYARSAKVLSVKVQGRQTDSDRTLTKIRYKAQKKIVGVTLDVEHSVSAYSIDTHTVPNIRRKNESMAAVGRKYFISGKRLTQTADNEITFEIPIEEFKQTKLGPQMMQNMGFGYNHRYQNTYNTMTDLGERRIVAMWMHFSDGTVEKVPSEKLPKRFDTVSTETHQEEERKRDRAWRAIHDQFDHSLVPQSIYDFEPSTIAKHHQGVLSCKSVFSN